MGYLSLNERLDLLVALGQHLSNAEDTFLDAILHRTSFHNPWFSIENQRLAIAAIAEEMLQWEKLWAWASQYPIQAPTSPKRLGLVMAGNIPMVGFHDFICSFVAGFISKIKLSEKDPFVLPYLFEWLGKKDPRFKSYVEVVDKLQAFDVVIATGSNNSARYFEAYFGKYPHIIRKNRNAVAVLTGTESSEELHALGKDVFRFFGLGCRNVSKIFVPMDYDFQLLMERLHDYREIILHDKYKNNFDYSLALLMLNRVAYINNGCVILVESPSIASRIAVLHFEYYQSLESVTAQIKAQSDEVQCVVSGQKLAGLDTVAFGESQRPGLQDYPDGVDVMRFLTGL